MNETKPDKTGHRRRGETWLDEDSGRIINEWCDATGRRPSFFVGQDAIEAKDQFGRLGLEAIEFRIENAKTADEAFAAFDESKRIYLLQRKIQQDRAAAEAINRARSGERKAVIDRAIAGNGLRLSR